MSNQNRGYKNTVFVDLFGDDEIDGPKNFLSLYNAIHGTDLKLENTKLVQKKIPQAVYQTLNNDVSFMVNDRVIVLFEHQSTVNENMPLRCLEYITRLYETVVPFEKRYAKKLVKIPLPEFYVFYNGTENVPDEYVLKLSDAFEIPEKNENDIQSGLELIVKVFRISSEQKLPIVSKCDILKEYCMLVDMVRKNSDGGDKNSYQKAVELAISKGILREYLLRKGVEVNNMFMGEYDYATDIKVQRQEAFEKGKSQRQEEIFLYMKSGHSLEDAIKHFGDSNDDSGDGKNN